MSEVTEYKDQDPMIAFMERMAVNPDVTIDKMERMLQMQERILDRNAEQSFSSDMVAAQSLMPAIKTTSWNDQTKSNYAKLDAIVTQASPVWTKAGFALSFAEDDCPNKEMIRVVCDVRHREGHCVRYHHDLPLDDSGIKGTTNKTATHATGSTMSYGRRYLTCMIFNIATGDDVDGNQPVQQFIGDNQVLEITAYIQENGLDEAEVLKFMRAKGVSTFELIPNDGSFGAIMKRLKGMVK